MLLKYIEVLHYKFSRGQTVDMGSKHSQPSRNAKIGSYPLVIKHGNVKGTIYKADFPTKASIYRGFSIAMFDYQRVTK